jgi:RHS repeat-associated protein
MKGLIRIRLFRALCALLVVAGPAAALLAQNGPPNKDRYIIVLKPPKNGVPELSDHDITAGGGKVEYKVPGRIQVTLPAPAVEAMRKQERVKYIQKVILGPLPDASAPAALRMTPLTASLRASVESAPPTWRSGSYKYDASGNIYAIGVADDTGSPLQHRYAYDELSRLKRADTMTSPTTHTETFTYDVYGNLTGHVDGSSTTSTPVESPNTNRLAWSAAHPYTYDVAGNLTADYNATYAYDPVGMLREKDYTNEVAEYYIYTASDERIGVKYGTSSGSPTIWSIRDFSGNVLRQYEGHDQSSQMAWTWVEDYVYRDGQLLAAERVPEEGGRRHFHLDHLGSPRLVTGQDSKEMSEHDYKPFGLELNYQETAGGFDREDPKRFTGHERDYAAPGESPASTAYLDYMHARYYSPNVGRFLSLDPSVSSGRPTIPQSWNRYTYARNAPVTMLDPNGKETIVFIIGASNIGRDLSGAFGHTAVWVSSGGHSNGWSFGGTFAFKKDRGYMDLVRSYQAEGRSVHVFHLKTTPAQDAKELAYVNKSAPTDFNICTNNCTTTTWQVLQAGGVIPERVPVYCGYCGIADRPNTPETSPEGLEGELEGEYSSIVQREYFVQQQRQQSLFGIDDPQSSSEPWMFENSFGARIHVIRR